MKKVAHDVTEATEDNDSDVINFPKRKSMHWLKLGIGH